MEKKLTIENITNGLLTFQKLKQLYNKDSRGEGTEASSYVGMDRLSLFKETLTAISDFVPPTRGSNFTEAFHQGTRYSTTYRSIKQQIRNINGRQIDSSHFLNIMKLVVPILTNKQRVYMDKVVKILDILQSP